jgi:uncharacterized protein (TIGR01777 family)
MRLARPLRIVIPGGTGRIGVLLARHFHQLGHSVSTITRFPKPSDWEAIHWDAENPGVWVSALEDADLIINLAGRSHFCRYTAANRASILHSRVRTTELLAQAISECAHPPRLWMNASTTDLYASSHDHEVGEYLYGMADNEFNFAKSWEAAVQSLPTPNTRKICFRLAPVMKPDSGLFVFLLGLVRWGFGGEMGNGEQYVDWVHDFDFIRAIEFLLEHDQIHGAVNITSPCPIPNHQFMCNLRRAWCTSYFGLPAPAWLVRAATFALRVQPELVLKSRRVVPKRLLESGFAFHFPEWRGACENLVERWRQLHESGN